MKTIQALFEIIRYDEISGLFDRLEQSYSALTEPINLEIPEDAGVEEVMASIERHAVLWDRIIERNQAGKEYLQQAKNILITILGRWRRIWEEGLLYDEEVVEPLQKWSDELNTPYSFAYLLYVHQRLRQLKQMVELYQRQADMATITSRHLFERGFALLHTDSRRYMRMVFDHSDSYVYDNSLRFISSHVGFYTLHGKPLIDWIKKSPEARTARHSLYKNLKYADLAYRNHTKKGKNLEVLTPYTLHLSKYAGGNIEGRFRLKGNMNGFVGYRKDNTIVIGFSGTEFFSRKNWKTNICQYCGKLTPEYLQAAGLVHSVWMGKTHKKGFKKSKVIVCGHSLGGGLMQFAVGMNGKDDMFGYGYNSAGLSMHNLQEIRFDKELNIYHLYQPMDAVFVLPFTSQLGKSVKSKKFVIGAIRAHLMGSLRRHAGVYKNCVALI